MTMEKLSDEVLLSIFHCYLDASPQFWLRLVHICRKWRHIIFASRRALHIRLFCAHGTPVLNTLHYWPALPIVVQYGGSLALDPPAPEDEDNIMAALKQSDRVSSISLTVTTSLLEKLSAIERPFSQLEDLVLLSRDSMLQTLPSAFRWGPRLRSLHSTRIAFPELLQLLHSSRNLVDLQLHEVINPWHLSPEALTDALSGVPQLQSLSLHLLSTADYIALDLAPPPLPGGRVVLPVLTRLDFRGSAQYLEGLLTRIDSPCLQVWDIKVTLFNEFIFDPSKLSEFINRIGLQKSHLRADILSSERAISISFTRPEAPSRLELQVSFKTSALQLEHMVQICKGLSTFLRGVEHLRISATQPSPGKDNSVHKEWIKLICLFRGAKWVHVAGDHPTNILRALQLRKRPLPALRELYIAQPGPRHAPLREAVVSFMTERRLFGRPIAVEYEQLCDINEQRGTGPFSQQATMEKLSDDVLLDIFKCYMDDSAPFWFTLAHVCRSWRLIVVNYGRFPTAPEDEDNIMAALEQSDRVYSINLTVTSSLLKRLSTISEPLSELEELVLLSQDNLQLTLPSTFWWGHRLRTLHSTRIAFPSLPQLLSPSQDLIDLQLHEIPSVGYFSPEAFANALCGMTQLETLSLHFLTLRPRRSYLGLPPPPGNRFFLPALTRFKYRGISKYLDNLVARIDAPRLGDVDIKFFSQPTLDASQLGLFINRIESWGSPLRAEILSSDGAISITFTRPGALTRLGLEISCKQLDWQLFSISQICDHFSSFLFNVEDLGIKTIGPSIVPDDVDDEQWLGLIRAFDGARDLRVSGQLAIDMLRALRPADEGHTIVLPALRNLYVQESVHNLGPLRDSMESFVTQRRLSSHPVRVYPSSESGSILTQSAGPVPIRRPTTEEVNFAKRWVDERRRTAFGRSFEGVAGSPIPESEIPEYIRRLEGLDMVLGNIERYIHIAFAALNSEDVVRRMFAMMAPTKFQLEESKRPNPRYVLELHTIQRMTQEADNMDKGLRTALGLKLSAQSAPVPQQPQQPPSIGPTPSFTQPPIGTQG
ncbi:hypothetical protein BJY52DRAFT_1419288 [Lactarius psammicola]|nr:hypothetical protein BJY52DRAFT_1419288 [Lactarius psammicola]